MHQAEVLLQDTLGRPNPVALEARRVHRMNDELSTHGREGNLHPEVSHDQAATRVLRQGLRDSQDLVFFTDKPAAKASGTDCHRTHCTREFLDRWKLRKTKASGTEAGGLGRRPQSLKTSRVLGDLENQSAIPSIS